MTINESTTDRIIRAIIAAAALAGAFAIGLASFLGVVLVVLGAVLAVTAAVGFCPLYKVLGISTAKAPEHAA